MDKTINDTDDNMRGKIQNELPEDLRTTRRRTTKTWKNLEAKIFKYDIHSWVFFVRAFIITAGVAATLIIGKDAETAFKALLTTFFCYPRRGKPLAKRQ
ncbi:MAG: hypothetical protein ACLFQV_09320 [Vulcanimicrobiota bacterium]